MTPNIRIVVSENLEIFRKSLAAFLGTQPEFEVVAEAGSGKELLERLKHNKTDLVLLDADMPVLEGSSVLRVIQHRYKNLKVIALSQQTDTRKQAGLMNLGAHSVLGKNCEMNTLVEAIRKVNKDGYYLNTPATKALLDSMLHNKNSETEDIRFNQRETEILREICDGKTNKQIAVDLHLSSSTVDFYRTKIYQKVKCNNVAGLLKYAVSNGLFAFS